MRFKISLLAGLQILRRKDIYCSVPKNSARKGCFISMATCILFGLQLDSLSAQQPVRGEWGRHGDSMVLRTYSKSHFLAARRSENSLEERMYQDQIGSRKHLNVNGFLRYDFLYRSFIDTPFYQRDLRQHSLQGSFDILFDERHPIRLSFAARTSNSPFFRNFLDMNLAWDPKRVVQRKKHELLRLVERRKHPDLELLNVAINNEKEKLKFWQYQLRQPDIQQGIIEERERNVENWKNSKVKGRVDSMMDSRRDSLGGDFGELIARRKAEVDSLQRRIRLLQKRSDSIRAVIGRGLSEFRKDLNKASGHKDLKSLASQQGLPYSTERGLGKILNGMTGFGLGRSVIRYSELTAMDVSLSGFHIEYKAGLYTALAIGKVDYGFRDFIGRNRLPKSQDLLLGRIGLVKSDRFAVILTAYSGTKIPYVAVLPDSGLSRMQIAGYSVEVKYKPEEATEIIFEAAKSTRPVIGKLKDYNGISSLFKFKDWSNTAAFIRGSRLFRATNTQISGYVRYSGRDFQSYSLFPQNTRQSAWLMRLSQVLWKHRVQLNSSLRKNDFFNPFTEKSFSTRTLFASVQLNMRIPGWPSLSFGYFPGTQLYIIDKDRIRENAYYLMQGSLTHSFRTSKMQFVLSTFFSHYSSQATDSGFVSYNGNTYLLSGTAIFKKWRVLGTWSVIDRPELEYKTYDLGGYMSLGKLVNIGGGYKLSQLENGQTYFGGRAELDLLLPLLGRLKLQYDKSFLPTIRRDLFPVESGRVVWLKNF